jgi:hypothetical protein
MKEATAALALQFDFLRVAALDPHLQLRVLLAGRRAAAFAGCVDAGAEAASVCISKAFVAPHASLWAACPEGRLIADEVAAFALGATQAQLKRGAAAEAALRSNAHGAAVDAARRQGVCDGAKGDRQLARRDARAVVDAAARDIRAALVESARDPAHFAVGSWRRDAALATLRKCEARHETLVRCVAQSNADLDSERARRARKLADDHQCLLRAGAATDDGDIAAEMRRYVKRRVSAENARQKLRAKASAAEAALSFARAVVDALPAPAPPPSSAAVVVWRNGWELARAATQEAARQLESACSFLRAARGVDRCIVAHVRGARPTEAMIAQRQLLLDDARSHLRNAKAAVRTAVHYRRQRQPLQPPPQPPQQHQQQQPEVRQFFDGCHPAL